MNAAGIHVDADTTRPGWLGEPLDVAYAIDVLHPLCRVDALAALVRVRARSVVS